MEHIHFETCESTQKYLIERTKNEAAGKLLVSCDFQSHGIGQRNNTWDAYKNSLCFSFVAKENEVLNLTSLEMGVLICSFFKTTFNTNLKLKWPNDILNHNGEKVGGIIINKQGDQEPIIGIGLNMGPDKEESIQNYDIPAGFIFNFSKEYSKKETAKLIYDFINTHRLSARSTVEKWNNYCEHLNKKVTITDEDSKSGKFVGIGKYGQALIDNEGPILELYNGTLRVHD